MYSKHTPILGVHIRTHTYTHVLTNTRIHTYTYTQTHAYTHIHTRTHTPILGVHSLLGQVENEPSAQLDCSAATRRLNPLFEHREVVWGSSTTHSEPVAGLNQVRDFVTKSWLTDEQARKVHLTPCTAHTIRVSQNHVPYI